MGKRLGQHFLSDPAILDRIVRSLDPHPDDHVIEIGAGKGTLTARLAPVVGGVVAIERDDELAAALHDSAIEHCRVVSGDALNVDWRAELPPSVRRSSYKVAGNIPYAITTPLIDKALTEPLPTVIVFLVQKEVGDRLEAAPGSKTYGELSVGVQAVATVERLFAVRAGSFRPNETVGVAGRDREADLALSRARLRTILEQIFVESAMLAQTNDKHRSRAQAIFSSTDIIHLAIWPRQQFVRPAESCYPRLAKGRQHDSGRRDTLIQHRDDPSTYAPRGIAAPSTWACWTAISAALSR